MIPYKPFAQHLASNNVIASPSELHGHASGMIVMNNGMEANEWIKIILDDYCFESANQQKLVPVLSAMFEYAKDKLNADNYTFNILLPADEEDLSYRLEALSTWCSTFLTGMAFAGLKSDENMHQDVREFIVDLERISKVDTESEGTQGEEADFIELSEYVKAGTMLLFSEFQQEQDSPASTVQ